MTNTQLQKATALVFDRNLANNRPSFSMEMTLQQDEHQIVSCERNWYCIGEEPISREELVWSKQCGLHRIAMHNKSLEESGQLTHSGGVGEFSLRSKKTDCVDKIKPTRFNHSPTSLLSLPFETAKHWHSLKQGKSLVFDYSVLKVQAHTRVRLNTFIDDDFLIAKITPVSYFWRLIFGSSYMYFDKDIPILHKIDGLIEPRDKKPNGRYKEYLASMEFSNPIDLSTFAV